MNDEKELLLKLLVEKYNQDDDCDYSGPWPSIANALLAEVEGCNDVRIRVTSGWLTAEVSVSGGTPLTIADVLHRKKPFGVELVGDLKVVVKDSSGCDRFVSFNYEYV